MIESVQSVNNTQLTRRLSAWYLLGSETCHVRKATLRERLGDKPGEDEAGEQTSVSPRMIRK